MKKTSLIPFAVGCSLYFAQTAASAQEFKAHINKQFTLQAATANTVLAVYNISGSIKVEGYNGDKILIEADETLSAKNEKDLETGKREFKLGFEQKADSVIAYISAPFDSRPHDNYSNHHDIRINYHFLVNYTIKVPYNVSLHVSTVNDGNINIKDIGGSLNVNNVNGAISIINAKGTTNAHTINGDLTVNYSKVPPEASTYYTLNGKLEVIYPKSLSANVQLKSFNGEFFTDFENAVTLPAKVITTKEKTGSGTRFKLDKNSEIKIGNGGKLFKFETFNGNIYIKKQS